MPNFNHTDLSVCVVCLHVLANGQYDDGTDAAEQAVTGIYETWGHDQQHLIAVGDDLGFSTSDCDACGDSYHGDRYSAVALIPTTVTPVTDTMIDAIYQEV